MRKLPISWAASRFDREMRFKETTWRAIQGALSQPKISSETYDEYLGWDKEKQLSSKDVGYYIIGEFRDNLRHNAEFVRRGTVTLDIDEPGVDFETTLAEAFEGVELFWHTSRKSSPIKPRIRVHIPLTRDVTDGEEHEALTRLMAKRYGIERIDRVSYVPAQMMFFPSRSSDGVFEFGSQTGKWLDPDVELETHYINWRDRFEWPRTATEIPPETRKEKIDSPLTKPGVIGAFNRAYTITRALEEVIPGIYEPSGDEGHRWRYHAAEGGGGAIVYDNDTILFSHHTNHDPVAGRSTNAFDLVRVHKFGSLDAPDPLALESIDLPQTQRPSFLAMQEFAMTLPDVVAELSAVSAFEGLDDQLPARVEPKAPLTDELGDELSEELPPHPVGRPAASRARLRTLLEECDDADAITDSILPILAGAALQPVEESKVLAEMAGRYKELSGHTLDRRALKKQLEALQRQLAVTSTKANDFDGLLDVNEDGRVLNTVKNMAEWLRAGHYGMKIALDKFTGRTMGSPEGVLQWREISDLEVIRIRVMLERDGFGSFGGGNDLIRQALNLVANENVIDTAQMWASTLIWDGKLRCEMFLTDYFGVKDSDYIRAVSRYFWSSLARRTLDPGVKADMILVLVGKQGLRKSSSLQAIVPSIDFFGELDFRKDDAERCRVMQGKLLVEWNELRGAASAGEDAIKTFLARQVDEWRPLFTEETKRAPRRSVIIGTTDSDEFLSDMAGNRRYLPFKPTRSDIAAILRDRDQLWAEAFETFPGVDWSAERLAAQAHEDHAISDMWDPLVLEWLEGPRLVGGFELDDGLGMTNGEGQFTLTEVMNGLNVPAARQGRTEQMRMARILKRFGFESAPQWYKGKTLRVWSKAA